MTTTKIVVACVLVAASIGTPVFLNYRLNARLREAQDTLQKRGELLAQLSADRDRLMQEAGRPKNSNSLSAEELSELLRLRNEVGRLRQETNTLRQLRNDNQLLEARLQAVQKSGATNSVTASPPEIYPKESWTFAGRATPEASMQSYFWAMSRGDSKVLLESLTDRQASEMAERFARTTNDFPAQSVRSVEKLSGFHIVSKEIISDSEVLLLVSAVMPDGVSKPKIMRATKVGNEWKLSDSN